MTTAFSPRTETDYTQNIVHKQARIALAASTRLAILPDVLSAFRVGRAVRSEVIRYWVWFLGKVAVKMLVQAQVDWTECQDRRRRVPPFFVIRLNVENN